MIAIFDLDGCVSDDRHREHLLPVAGETSSSAYDAYHVQCWHDEPMNVQTLKDAARRHTIMFVTSRPERFREVTRSWIQTKLGLSSYTLLMRGHDCRLPSPAMKVDIVFRECGGFDGVAAAYDDRLDVLDAYAVAGLAGDKCHHLTYPQEAIRSVPVILHRMAATFEERNAVYKDNYRVTAQILGVLFPNGVPADVVRKPAFHMLIMKIGKLTRFVATDLTHQDSIHDDAVYAAMIESTLDTP